jgi:hypothetical protein
MWRCLWPELERSFEIVHKKLSCRSLTPKRRLVIPQNGGCDQCLIAHDGKKIC